MDGGCIGAGKDMAEVAVQPAGDEPPSYSDVEVAGMTLSHVRAAAARGHSWPLKCSDFLVGDS